MTAVDEAYQRAAEIQRDSGHGALVAYFATLDRHLALAVHHRLVEGLDRTKRDLRQALDDQGILNDPTSTWWQRRRAASRTLQRRRRYKNRNAK